MTTSNEDIVEYRRTGSIELRNAIVEKNGGLVVFMTNKYATKYGIPHEELESEFWVAMIHAVDAWDPERSKTISPIYNYKVLEAFERYCKENEILFQTDDIENFHEEDTKDETDIKITVDNLMKSASLTNREQKVCKWLFVDERRLQWIADREGCSRQRIDQIKSGLLKKLRRVAEPQMRTA